MEDALSVGTREVSPTTLHRPDPAGVRGPLPAPNSINIFL